MLQLGIGEFIRRAWPGKLRTLRGVIGAYPDRIDKGQLTDAVSEYLGVDTRQAQRRLKALREAAKEP